ncbi:DNA polymerase III subunit beta [Candidatus Xianfuyuplasma coldseepsis]|uniref:Beta sliding clamp n=1 Tax=Candidatus Xianfuyuplasma coldseepsis TaxID=2782163 RepID=A0A7L7KRX2_9MOLU|nr:DNA polymerase III subunit beta [Xianfuyuplasma coldseepsis]QMS84946.1 DNA polymerase III subunit beta [Xianfuyuplasma coldseepsis]
MNFQINKDTLLNNLIVAQKALSNKTPNPALQGIKLEVLKDHLVITTSNSDIAIKLTVKDASLAVKSEGSVLIPGKYFIEIIRKLDGLKVQLSMAADNMLRIEADRSDITLNMMDLDDYPELQFSEKVKSIKINVRVLKTIIRQTAFATSSIENRPILTGVNFKIDGKKLIAIATDSYRLSQKEIELNESYEALNIIIPGRSLEELIKVLENNNDQVELHFDHSKILFKYNNLLFQSRLLEGNYPETSKLIPTEFATVIKFNKENLSTAIERASLLSSRDGNNAIVKLALRQDNIVEITSNSPEIGKVLEEVYPVDEIVGHPFKIAFSSKYILDALKIFNSSEVSVNFTGEIRPFIIKGEYDENMLQLILPVRTE